MPENATHADSDNSIYFNRFISETRFSELQRDTYKSIWFIYK